MLLLLPLSQPSWDTSAQTLRPTRWVGQNWRCQVLLSKPTWEQKLSEVKWNVSQGSIKPADQMFMSCDNWASSMFFCQKNFSREQTRAHKVLTPAELRLEHHFIEMLHRLYLPGIRLLLYRNLTLCLKAGAETWSQNRMLVKFSSSTQMAPLVVQKALPHPLQHSFP